MSSQPWQPGGQQAKCSLATQHGRVVSGQPCPLFIGLCLSLLCPQVTCGITPPSQVGCHRICILLALCGLACGPVFCENRGSKVSSELPRGLMLKNASANARDTGYTGSISGLGRFPTQRWNTSLCSICVPEMEHRFHLWVALEEEMATYSCLENSMDRGAWQVTVHRVTKSWTQLSN